MKQLQCHTIACCCAITRRHLQLLRRQLRKICSVLMHEATNKEPSIPVPHKPQEQHTSFAASPMPQCAPPEATETAVP